MKKRRKRQSHSSSLAALPESLGHLSSEEALHFRLCHVCLHLNESEGDIQQCQKCQRYLTIENMVEQRLARRRRGAAVFNLEVDDDIEDLSEDDFGEIPRFSGLNGLAVLW